MSRGQLLQRYAWQCRFGISESKCKKNHQGIIYGEDAKFEIIALSCHIIYTFKWILGIFEIPTSVFYS